jgi:hypothetical protein
MRCNATSSAVVREAGIERDCSVGVFSFISSAHCLTGRDILRSRELSERANRARPAVFSKTAAGNARSA